MNKGRPRKYDLENNKSIRMNSLPCHTGRGLEEKVSSTHTEKTATEGKLVLLFTSSYISG